MRVLTADELLALPNADEVTEEVSLAAWGLGTVRIRQFSIEEQRLIREQARGDGGDIDQARLDALTLAHGIVEPALTVEQAEGLLKKQFGPVQHILNSIHRLSGLTALLEVSAEAVAGAERRFRKR